MSSPGAIITLQLGQYADYVGAHFWNFQDEALGLLTDEALGTAAQEILAGKLFTHSTTLNPRLVAVDKAGCCGGVALQYSGPEIPKQLLWESGVQVIQSEKVVPSKFYQLLLDEAEDNTDNDSENEQMESPTKEEDEPMQEAGSSVDKPSPLEEAAAELDTSAGPTYFTDFFKCFLHPRSVVQVPLLGPLQPPAGFGEITADQHTHRQIMEDVEERIRHFAEEAASLEGFQVLCDPWSPWAGVTAACTAVLADDYPTQTRVLFSTRAPLDHDDALMHELAATGTLSGALSTARWMADCSLMVPLEPPAAPVAAGHLQLDSTRPFHAAAAAAAALDCCSLPWRVAPVAGASGRGAATAGGPDAATPSQGATTMAAWSAGLTARGANIAATGSVLPAVSVPFPAAVEGDMRLSARERRLRGLPVEAQPAVPPELVNELLAESVVWRGCRHDGRTIGAAQGLDFLKQGLEAEGWRGVRQLAAVAMPLPIPLPFPRAFRGGLSPHGDLAPDERRAPPAPAEHAQRSTQRQHVQTCAALSRTVASGVFEDVLKEHAAAIRGAGRSGTGKACLARWDMQGEDAAELREQLLCNAGLYRDVDWPSSSDDEGGL